MRPAVPLVAGLWLAACAPRLPTRQLEPVQGRFLGEVASKVSGFNVALASCGARRMDAARAYNTVQGRNNHWNFWTVTAGLMADAAAAIIAIADSGNKSPKIVVGISGAGMGLSQAVRAASGIEQSARARYDTYAYWNARIVAARADFERLQPALERGEPAPEAISALDSLTAGITRRCTEEPPAARQ